MATLATRSTTPELDHQYRIALVCMLVQFVATMYFTVCWALAPDSEGLAVSGGYLSFVAALTPALYAFYRGHLAVLFNGISFINLSPIWFLYLEAILPGYDAYEYSPPMYRLEAFCWVAIFLFFVNGLYVLTKHTLNRASRSVFGFVAEVKDDPRTFFYLTAFTFVFPLLAFLAYYGSPTVLWTAITGGRSGGGSHGGLLIQTAVGDTSSLMLPVNYLWQVTPYFGMVAFVQAKRKLAPLPLLAFLMGFLTVFVFFLSGSRGNMMYVASPILFTFFYFNWNRGIKFWILVGFLFTMLIAVMEIQVRFRGNLLEVLADPEAAARKAGLESVTTLDVTESHRDNNMYMLCLILEGFPDKYGYEGFNDFVATVANPIPRAFWPDKPLLIGAKALVFQSRWVLDGPIWMGTTSLSYSVVGEAYKARGLLGILIYAGVYAIFLAFVDGIVYYLRQRETVVVGILGLGIFLAFWGFRSFFAFVTFIYPFGAVIVVLYGLHLYSRRR